MNYLYNISVAKHKTVPVKFGAALVIKDTRQAIFVQLTVIPWTFPMLLVQHGGKMFWWYETIGWKSVILKTHWHLLSIFMSVSLSPICGTSIMPLLCGSRLLDIELNQRNEEFIEWTIYNLIVLHNNLKWDLI